MENLNKYLVSGYAVVAFFIGLLFYLSKTNSEYIIFTLVFFLIIISIYFFYGMTLFKNEKEIIIHKDIEKRVEDDSEFLAELTNFSSLVSKNNFKDKNKNK